MGRKKNLKGIDDDERSITDYSNSSKFLNYKINLKCKNKKQKDLVKTIEENKIVFVEGVFGVGKTYVINSIALKMLKEIGNGIDKIILIMPTLEVGQMHMGMLPGTLEEKLVAHLSANSSSPSSHWQSAPPIHIRVLSFRALW